jgi:hypothetical protein
MLVKDFCYFINNHFFINFHYIGIFKVVTYQFLNELTQEDVLIPLFKGCELSEALKGICELPEFLGELKPRLKVVRVRILFAT